jgi:hypothetical protein
VPGKIQGPMLPHLPRRGARSEVVLKGFSGVSSVIESNDLVESHIPYSVHASTGSARTEHQWVTPFTLSLSKGEQDFYEFIKSRDPLHKWR